MWERAKTLLKEKSNMKLTNHKRVFIDNVDYILTCLCSLTILPFTTMFTKAIRFRELKQFLELGKGFQEELECKGYNSVNVKENFLVI